MSWLEEEREFWKRDKELHPITKKAKVLRESESESESETVSVTEKEDTNTLNIASMAHYSKEFYGTAIN